MTIGSAIRIARKHGTHKMSEMELAEKVGVSFKTVLNWECGNTIPRFDYVVRVLNILHLSFDSLMSLISDDYAQQYRAQFEKPVEVKEDVWESVASLISQSSRV